MPSPEIISALKRQEVKKILLREFAEEAKNADNKSDRKSENP